MSLQITSLTPLIEVFDMPESVRFYCDMLGFEIAQASPEVDAPEGRHFQWALLRQGQTSLMLNTAYDAGERPPQPDETRRRGHADVMLYLGCRDVDAAYETLAAKGLALRPPNVAPYGMKQLHLRDPDGYGVCFQQPSS